MKIYVMTTGAYEDERIVGVSTDPDRAVALAREASVTTKALFGDWTVYGPLTDGALFTGPLNADHAPVYESGSTEN